MALGEIGAVDSGAVAAQIEVAPIGAAPIGAARRAIGRATSSGRGCQLTDLSGDPMQQLNCIGSPDSMREISAVLWSADPRTFYGRG
jgi:hypothetical protein